MAKKKTSSKKRPASKRTKKDTPKKRGILGNMIGKIPETVRIKGGKAKSGYKTKHGSIQMESEYKDLEVGKK